MDEKDIEKKLVQAVRAAGGYAFKFVSPGFAGMPDRLVLMPHGKCGFVEVKAPGKKPRVLQVHRHALLRHLGFPVFVLDRIDAIPEIIEKIGGCHA